MNSVKVWEGFKGVRLGVLISLFVDMQSSFSLEPIQTETCVFIYVNGLSSKMSSKL